MDTVVILDFGSQYTQLIARRVREANVYSELHPFDVDAEIIAALDPKAFIISGGPNSVYAEDAPTLPDYILASGVPVLGICYGMQLLAHSLGGAVTASNEREYGRATVDIAADNTLLQTAQVGQFNAWMSHGDKVTQVPAGFSVTATSQNCPIAAMENAARKLFAVQFHPEVNHTELGRDVINNFLTVAEVSRDWNAQFMIDQAIADIKAKVGNQRVLAAVSGGVDSTVATALVSKAIGEQLTCFYVDTGLMRANETEQVIETFTKNIAAEFEPINAVEDFLGAIGTETEPEAKRKIIGNTFIRIFEREARRLGKDANFLVQGTIYPDVVESSGKGREKAAKIKTHHNVGGLPDDLQFELLEPLRYMFKDEVRKVGEALGLPEEMVWRQPFPGPGLGIRCLGQITWERLETLRSADKILRDELRAAGMLKGDTAQAFAVLLPVKSVGVMGDQRTYEEVVALRAVTTDDFMTADWAHLPYELLAKISSRICNEVRGVNRVVYDITSKPPGTIEWE